MPIRLKDIARELDVSVMTVSKALRGSKDISEATRTRILHRMRELNYRPNMNARALATGCSSILGLIVPDLLHPFFSELAKSIGGTLRQHSNGLILASSEEDAEIEKAEIRMMLARGVDALLIASCQRDLAGFYDFQDQSTPYILVDRAYPHLRANFVGTDDFAGGILATTHLIEIGRQRIAHIAGPELSPGADRLQGYRTALRRHDLGVREDYIASSSLVEEAGEQGGYQVMQKLLALEPRPDAVFCYNDNTAIGAMQAALEAGLSIPADLAFVGFGNVRYSEYLRVPLTSVNQPTAQLGETAARLALDLVRSKSAEPRSSEPKSADPGNADPKLAQPRTIRLAPTLVIRESTAGPSLPAIHAAAVPS